MPTIDKIHGYSISPRLWHAPDRRTLLLNGAYKNTVQNSHVSGICIMSLTSITTDFERYVFILRAGRFC